VLQSPSPLEVGSPWLCSPVSGAGSSQDVPAGSGARTGKGGNAGQGLGAPGVPSATLTAVPGSAPQKALKEMFPIESGDINMESRIIPHLPGEGQALGLAGGEHKLRLLGNSPAG